MLQSRQECSREGRNAPEKAAMLQSTLAQCVLCVEGGAGVGLVGGVVRKEQGLDSGHELIGLVDFSPVT